MAFCKKTKPSVVLHTAMLFLWSGPLGYLVNNGEPRLTDASANV